jgi:uncharacterized membrane protein YgaE (UPF0421/DUF939 family)
MKKISDNIKSKLLLSENAKLFDTKEYLLKTFIAVIIAGFIGNQVTFVSKDMISLLFGMLLTLEPINMAGIRSGFSQLKASVIGAIVTGIVVALLGYNSISMAIGITLTLYVCMLINWRELMVVAVFTSIYMTQYIQFNAEGQESSIETFKLRIAALGTGVIIALIVNFLFSIFGYKRLVNKRIYYISKEVQEYSQRIKSGLEEKDMEVIEQTMAQFPQLFNTIDWITSTLADAKKDRQRLKLVYRHFDVERFLDYSLALREVSHIVYDLCYRIKEDPKMYMTKEFTQPFNERLKHFEDIKNSFIDGKSVLFSEWRESPYPWINRYSRTLNHFAKKNT